MVNLELIRLSKQVADLAISVKKLAKEVEDSSNSSPKSVEKAANSSPDFITSLKTMLAEENSKDIVVEVVQECRSGGLKPNNEDKLEKSPTDSKTWEDFIRNYSAPLRTDDGDSGFETDYLKYDSEEGVEIVGVTSFLDYQEGFRQIEGWQLITENNLISISSYFNNFISYISGISSFTVDLPSSYFAIKLFDRGKVLVYTGRNSYFVGCLKSGLDIICDLIDINKSKLMDDFFKDFVDISFLSHGYRLESLFTNWNVKLVVDEGDSAAARRLFDKMLQIGILLWTELYCTSMIVRRSCLKLLIVNLNEFLWDGNSASYTPLVLIRGKKIMKRLTIFVLGIHRQLSPNSAYCIIRVNCRIVECNKAAINTDEIVTGGLRGEGRWQSSPRSKEFRLGGKEDLGIFLWQYGVKVEWKQNNIIFQIQFKMIWCISDWSYSVHENWHNSKFGSGLLMDYSFSNTDGAKHGNEQQQQRGVEFTEAYLTWLSLKEESTECRRILLVQLLRAKRKEFEILVDGNDGLPIIWRCLTFWLSYVPKKGYRGVEVCKWRMGNQRILIEANGAIGDSWVRKKELWLDLAIGISDSWRNAYKSQITSKFVICKRKIHSPSSVGSVEFIGSQWWQIVHSVRLKKHDRILKVQFEVIVLIFSGCLIAYTQKLLKKLISTTNGTTILSKIEDVETILPTILQEFSVHNSVSPPSITKGHNIMFIMLKYEEVKEILVSALQGLLIIFLNVIKYIILRRFCHELYAISPTSLFGSTSCPYLTASQMGEKKRFSSSIGIGCSSLLEFVVATTLRGEEYMSISQECPLLFIHSASVCTLNSGSESYYMLAILVLNMLKLEGLGEGYIGMDLRTANDNQRRDRLAVLVVVVSLQLQLCIHASKEDNRKIHAHASVVHSEIPPMPESVYTVATNLTAEIVTWDGSNGLMYATVIRRWTRPLKPTRGRLVAMLVGLNVTVTKSHFLLYSLQLRINYNNHTSVSWARFIPSILEDKDNLKEWVFVMAHLWADPFVKGCLSGGCLKWLFVLILISLCKCASRTLALLYLYYLFSVESCKGIIEF